MATDYNSKGIKKNGVRSVIIYIFSNFFNKGAAFLLLIVFTDPAYITPSENGLLALFSNSMLLLIPFLSMGIIYSTGADYFKLDKKEFRDLFTSGFFMSFIVMLIAIVVLYVLREQLSSRYGFQPMFVWLIPVVAFFVFCNEQLLNIARSREDTKLYLRSSMTRVFLELSISFVLVVVFAWHWQGRIAGLFTAYTVISLYAFYYFKKNDFLFGQVSARHIKKELIYAVPIIALQLATFSMGSSDRFFLAAFTNDNNETVGIYNVAATFGAIIIILCTATLQYFFPKIYEQLAKGVDADYAVIRKYFRTYLLIMTGGLLLIMIFIPVAYHLLVHEKYYGGLKYVYLLCGGNFLWSIGWFFFSFLLFYKDKKKIFGLSCCYILISMAVNYFLIKRWGVWGAATANICTYLVVLLITLYFTRSFWKNLFIKTLKK